MNRFFRSALFPLVIIAALVWLATHTRRTITTSGKSAERKNRFTGPLSAQGTSEYEPHRFPDWGCLKRVGKQVLVQYADVGQVPVPLGEIEPVADDELVRDLEAHIAHRNVDFAP